MAARNTSAGRGVAKALVAAVALVAIVLGALPLLSPQLFVPEEHLAAVRAFFSQSATAPAWDEEAWQATTAPRATTHTNNWAVLVCTSKFWFNYRVCTYLSHLSAYGQCFGHVSYRQAPWYAGQPYYLDDGR